jgi:phosphatidylserine/phosphatidylglycerophosphate/cardiolipin synthase-like enzyme
MDIHHNFVQRWNNASERGRRDGVWGDTAAAQLPTAFTEPGPLGSTVVQLQRTMPATEATIFEQYRLAIALARHSIYIENQALDVPVVLRWLRQAAERGVEVVAVLPGEPEPVRRRPPAWDDEFTALAARENFTCVGLAGIGRGDDRPGVYVHSKVMLVDDEWATIGSANLHAASLFHNAEMNASFWDPDLVRHLRCQLFAEHLGESPEPLHPAAAHRRFRYIARENQRQRDAGRPWRGLAFSLDPTDYARRRFVA